MMRVETFRTALLTLTVLVLLSGGFAYADNIYVSCYGAGMIEKLNSSGNISPFALGLNHPTGLAFDRNGHLYTANYNDGTIVKLDSNGNSSPFASGLDDPISLAFDSNGYLYAANWNNGTIEKFDANGSGSTFASGLNQPYGLAFDSNGCLYVSNEGGGTIMKFDSSGNGSNFASGLDHPYGLAFDSSGYLYVTYYQGGTIEKFNSNGNGSPFASGLNGPVGLAFDSSGYLYAANLDNGTIVKFEPNGNESTFASGLSQPFFIAMRVPVKVTKCSVTAGSKENTDKISFSGTMNTTFDDFNNAHDVNVIISSVYMNAPYVKTFDINDKTFKKGKFSSTITNKPSKTSFAFDIKKKTFSFSAGNIDLTGLSCPVGIEITVGDWTGTAEVNEAIVNGPKKPIPINLLMDVKNSLRVDKSKFTRDKNTTNITQIAISGGFSVGNLNDANMAEHDFVVQLAGQTFTIPAGNFKANKNGNKFTCSKVSITGGVASATFDFNKCTWTLTIKNTNFAAAADDEAILDIDFASFSGSSLVILP